MPSILDHAPTTIAVYHGQVPRGMEKIIRNLITNAVKFSPYGGNVTIRFLACLEPRQEQEEATADLLPQLGSGIGGVDSSLNRF